MEKNSWATAVWTRCVWLGIIGLGNIGAAIARRGFLTWILFTIIDEKSLNWPECSIFRFGWVVTTVWFCRVDLNTESKALMGKAQFEQSTLFLSILRVVQWSMSRWGFAEWSYFCCWSWCIWNLQDSALFKLPNVVTLPHALQLKLAKKWQT